MAIIYKYKGQEVELVPGQQFSSHWNVYYNMPTENGGSRRTIITVVPGETLEIVDDATPETPSTSASSETGTQTQLDINLSGFTAIKNTFPGIGRVAASKIVKNRPATGYRDIDELMELNKDLNINWEELKGLLIFTPLDN